MNWWSFEKNSVGVQDLRRLEDRFGGIYGIYLELIKKT
jgi:hypothetical protein